MAFQRQPFDGRGAAAAAEAALNAARRAWGITSDLLIAIAILWTVPLLLGLAAALVRLIRDAN